MVSAEIAPISLFLLETEETAECLTANQRKCSQLMVIVENALHTQSRITMVSTADQRYVDQLTVLFKKTVTVSSKNAELVKSERMLMKYIALHVKLTLDQTMRKLDASPTVAHTIK